MAKEIGDNLMANTDPIVESSTVPWLKFDHTSEKMLATVETIIRSQDVCADVITRLVNQLHEIEKRVSELEKKNV